MSIETYYARRAQEYERIYAKPERQEDLRTLRSIVEETFRGKHVLEIACGTGYWTEILARSARTVTAVDINEVVLDIARTKSLNGRSAAPMCTHCPISHKSSMPAWQPFGGPTSQRGASEIL